MQLEIEVHKIIRKRQWVFTERAGDIASIRN